MGGFLGVGGNGPDKQFETKERGNLDNIFNYALPSGQTGEAKGQNTVDAATAYWRNQLAPGRAQAAQNAAPAVNQAVAGADAAKAQGATMGTGRGGGTAAINREIGTTTQGNIDNIVNQNVVSGREHAAAGMESAGGLQLQNALNLLGLGGQSATTNLNNAEQDRAGVRNAQAQVWSTVISHLL